MSVGVGRIFESVCLSVCLFVHSITQKRMIPKCSNLGYPRSGTVLGFKVQGHMVSKFILHTRTLHTRTAIHRHSLGWRYQQSSVVLQMLSACFINIR